MQCCPCTPISRYKLATRFTENYKIIAITRSALFSSKCTTNHLAAGLHPDPLDELTALPRPLAGLRGGAPGRERGGGRKGKGGEGIGDGEKGTGRGMEGGGKGNGGEEKGKEGERKGMVFALVKINSSVRPCYTLVRLSLSRIQMGALGHKIKRR